MTELVEPDFLKLPWHELGFMDERYADGSEARLHFAQCNAAKGGSLPTIVFMHGVLRDWRSFYPLLFSLRGRANLVSFDFRGHGRSDPTPGAYRVINYVEDAVRLIESLTNQVILYGHSLGAMVALATAAQIPERIQTTILEDPPFSTMGSRLRGTPLMRYFESVEALVRNETLPEKGSDPLEATQSQAAFVVAGEGQTPFPAANAEARIHRLFDEFSNIAVATRPDGSIIRVRDQRDLVSRRFSAEGLAKVDPEVLVPVTAGQWLDGYDLDSLLPLIKSKVVLLRADNACGGMLTSDEADHISRGLDGVCEQIYFTGVGHSMHWVKPMEITEIVMRQF